MLLPLIGNDILIFSYILFISFKLSRMINYDPKTDAAKVLHRINIPIKSAAPKRSFDIHYDFTL